MSKLENLHPVLAEKAKALLFTLPNITGMEAIVTQGYRSIEEQNELYAQGRTKPGKVVTNARGGESYHNYGMAFDIGFIDKQGKLTYEVDWKKVGAEGKALQLEWGGDWILFKDKPHFQLTGGLSIKDLQRSGDWKTLVNIALNSYAVPTISEWAESSVDKARNKGITDWSNPQEFVGNSILEDMFLKAGILSQDFNNGITKERMAVILDRLGLLE